MMWTSVDAFINEATPGRGFGLCTTDGTKKGEVQTLATLNV
jgi:hypothetical protein